MTMSSREIAELTGKRHDNVVRDIREMLDELSDSSNLRNVREDKDARGYTAEYHLPKHETLVLVSGYSIQLRSKIIRRWEELEQVVAQPNEHAIPFSKAIEDFHLAVMVAKELNFSPSSKLGAIRTVLTAHDSAAVLTLPAYAIDAPTGATAGSSEPTASLTTLLKKYGSGLTATKANLILHRAGFLEMKTRPSSKHPDEVRSFWSVTEKGLAYGKNVTNEKNQRETQPHWYESTFSALCAEAGIIAVQL